MSLRDRGFSGLGSGISDYRADKSGAEKAPFTAINPVHTAFSDLWCQQFAASECTKRDAELVTLLFDARKNKVLHRHRTESVDAIPKEVLTRLFPGGAVKRKRGEESPVPDEKRTKFLPIPRTREEILPYLQSMNGPRDKYDSGRGRGLRVSLLISDDSLVALHGGRNYRARHYPGPGGLHRVWGVKYLAFYFTLHECVSIYIFYFCVSYVLFRISY